MKSHKKLMLSIALGMMMGVTAPGALAGERAANEKELTQMARAAASPAQHANVATQYMARAEALDAKADKLEQELRDSDTRAKTAMDQKWPGLMAGMRERKEKLAMQTRRAAQESRDLAMHHSRLSGRNLDEIAKRD